MSLPPSEMYEPVAGYAEPYAITLHLYVVVLRSPSANRDIPNGVKSTSYV